jgi:glutathione S-transferase
MPKLYHYWSSVCSQKARMCLAEKKIPWQSQHVDIFKFENYSNWYTRLNPKNVVPGFQEAFAFKNPDPNDLVKR